MISILSYLIVFGDPYYYPYNIKVNAMFVFTFKNIDLLISKKANSSITSKGCWDAILSCVGVVDSQVLGWFFSPIHMSFILSRFWGTSLLTIINNYIPFNDYIWSNIVYVYKISISGGVLIPLYYSILFTDTYLLVFPCAILNFVSEMVLTFPWVDFFLSDKSSSW